MDPKNVKNNEGTPEQHQRRERHNYTAEQRRGLLKQFKALRKDGKTAQQAADKLDVPYITLNSWGHKKGTPERGEKAKRGRKASKKVARKVRKDKKTARRGRPRTLKHVSRRANSKSGQIVITMPNGTRISCPTTHKAAKLLNLM